MTKDTVELEAADYHAIVTVTAEKCIKIILRAIKPIAKEQRWLIIGRIVMLLFQSHFRFSIDIASESMDQNMAKAKK